MRLKFFFYAFCLKFDLGQTTVYATSTHASSHTGLAWHKPNSFACRQVRMKASPGRLVKAALISSSEVGGEKGGEEGGGEGGVGSEPHRPAPQTPATMLTASTMVASTMMASPILRTTPLVCLACS